MGMPKVSAYVCGKGKKIKRFLARAKRGIGGAVTYHCTENLTCSPHICDIGAQAWAGQG